MAKPINPLILCDSYKLGHMKQYPKGTTFVYSNFAARSFVHLNEKLPAEYQVKKMTWVGLTAVMNEMKQIWKEGFFDQNIDSIVEEFAKFIAPFVGPSGFDMEAVRRLHTLGYLPLELRALPEGSRVQQGIPLFTISNTTEDEYWLVNFVESYLSSELWKACNSATIASVYRRILDDYCDETGGDKSLVDWQGHDFSMRGMSGYHDAAKSGMGHLVYFKGSDSLPSVEYINKHYLDTNLFIAGSVPATEHSVMCMGGKEDEIGTFKRLITETYPSGVVSIVSDTWDFWQVITEFAATLKEDILSRTPDSLGLAKVVFRPDTGNPVTIICGDRYADPGSPEHKGAVECLWDTFGGTVNEKGYKVLNPRVGLIYGDSITPERALEILKRLKKEGFASTNIVFGIGSFTYQYATRDTLGFAMKATYGIVNGEGRDIFKDPKTDSLKTKRSAKGRLMVTCKDDVFVLKDQLTNNEFLGRRADGDCLAMVCQNQFVAPSSFQAVRDLANKTYSRPPF